MKNVKENLVSVAKEALEKGTLKKNLPQWISPELKSSQKDNVIFVDFKTKKKINKS